MKKWILIFCIVSGYGVMPLWAEDSCWECHVAAGSAEEDAFEEGSIFLPEELIKEDIHFQRGISCADCHGGDPNDFDMTAMAPEKGFRGAIPRNEIPKLCASCHGDASYMRRFNPNIPTDQYTKYLVSQHGKLNEKGDQKVAVCTSCHLAHGIRSVTDPLSPVFHTNAPKTCATCHSDPAYMKEYKIPTNQFEQYHQGVHGQALLDRGDRAAPACHSCHGSHDAARPRAIAVGNLCAQCHAISRDLFVHSPHQAAHEQMGLPECEVCHGSHLIQKTSDDMLGTGPNALCIQCHEAGTPAFHMASSMKASIESLKTDLQQAEAVITQAGHIGMSVDEANFELSQARNTLTQARTYVHSFSDQKVKEITDQGKALTQRAFEIGQKAIEAFQFRRKGFLVSSLIILVLIVGLILLIRSIEKGPPS